MTWEEEIKKNSNDLIEFNKAANKMYDIINKYHELDALDYDKHLMEFTKIVDVISEKLDLVV